MSGAAVAAIVLGGGAAAYFVAREAGLLGGGTAACTYAVSPASTTVSSAGGNVTITLTIPGEKACEAEEWTASSSAAFITFNGNSTTSGVGATTTTVRVEPNPPGNAPRTGTLTVAGQTINVTQAARCAFSVAPTSLTFPAAGGTAILTVTAAPAGCEVAAWTATTISTFVTLSPTSGTGNGTVTVTLPRNASQSGNLSGNITIAGIVVPFVQQAGLGITGCVAQRVQGADVPEARTIQLGKASGRFTFRYDNGATTPDRMVVIYEGRPLFDSGCAGTAGLRTVPLSYAGRSTTVTVQVMPNCGGGGSGSTWFFELACPQ